METTQEIGMGNVTDRRRWRISNVVFILFSLFHWLTWVQRCWPRATPDFGSVSVMSSFLLPRYPKASWYTPFRGWRRLNAVCSLVLRRIFAHISQNFRLRRPNPNPPGGSRCAHQTPNHELIPCYLLPLQHYDVVSLVVLFWPQSLHLY